MRTFTVEECQDAPVLLFWSPGCGLVTLNAFARFWDRESVRKLRHHPARTEPRPPGITQARLDRLKLVRSGPVRSRTVNDQTRRVPLHDLYFRRSACGAPDLERGRGEPGSLLAQRAARSNLSRMGKDRRAIPRHKTAICRANLSRPMKSGLADGMINSSSSVFDYGCGHGQDIELLTAQGVACNGWDPAFRPDSSRHPADIVNLGFVLNVIEDVAERATALRQAWGLARRLLIVATQVKEAGRGQSQVAFGDGVLTGLGTFQKFFTQGELKAYLETELSAEAIPASLGIFYVFKDETLQQQYLANRYRRRAAAPRKRISELRFEEHRDLLESFMAAIAELGRLPEDEEFAQSAELIARFGSGKRAFALRATGDWTGRVGRDPRSSSRRLLDLPRAGPIPQTAAAGATAADAPARHEGLFRHVYQGLSGGRQPALSRRRRHRDRRSLPALRRGQTLARRSLRSPQCAREPGTTLASLRGLWPGLPGRSGRGEPDQDPPPVGQALVPGLSRVRR